MAKKKTATKTIKPRSVKTPWMQWDLQFHNLLSLEEIPYEIPELEDCLTEYLAPLLRSTKFSPKSSLKYKWQVSTGDPRAYMLQLFVSPLPNSIISWMKGSPREITIVKEDGRYIVDINKERKRSTKNTVKLKPPAA